MNEYIGIDYGRGMVNINHKTGIRYGVISIHSVGEAWFEESIPEYGSDFCPNCAYEFKTEAKGDLRKCPVCNHAFLLYDLEKEPINFYYKSDGYLIAQGYDDIELIVIKSPYYTECMYCSPCFPGAGNIDSPIAGGIKAYCLGREWFNEEETGKYSECPHCNGTGIREKATIPSYDESRFVSNGGRVLNDKHVACWACCHNLLAENMGKVKEYVQKAPYPVYSVKTKKLIAS